MDPELLKLLNRIANDLEGIRECLVNCLCDEDGQTITNAVDRVANKLEGSDGGSVTEALEAIVQRMPE